VAGEAKPVLVVVVPGELGLGSGEGCSGAKGGTAVFRVSVAVAPVGKVHDCLPFRQERAAWGQAAMLRVHCTSVPDAAMAAMRARYSASTTSSHR